MTTKFTRKDIQQRNHKGDTVFIIDNVVYDVTQFLEDHPGGPEVLLDNAGKDASKCFHDVGHTEDAYEWRKRFVIGEVVEEEKWEVIKRDTGTSGDVEPMTLEGMISLWGPPAALAAIAVFLYMYLFP